MRNKLFFAFLCFFIGATSLQAQEIRSGSLKIEYNGDNPVQIEMDGPMYFRESIDNSIVFSGLLPGEYTLKVYSSSKNRRGNVLVNKRISVVSEQRKIVRVEGNGKISIKSVVDNNTVFLSSRHYGEDSHFPGHPPGRLPEPLNDKDFNQIMGTLKKASFDKDKLDVLAVSTGFSLFSTEQIRVIMKSFSFDDGKLDAVKMLAPKAVDPQNLYTLGDDFSFISTKDKFYQYLKINSN